MSVGVGFGGSARTGPVVGAVELTGAAGSVLDGGLLSTGSGTSAVAKDSASGEAFRRSTAPAISPKPIKIARIGLRPTARELSWIRITLSAYRPPAIDGMKTRGSRRADGIGSCGVVACDDIDGRPGRRSIRRPPRRLAGQRQDLSRRRTGFGDRLLERGQPVVGSDSSTGGGISMIPLPVWR